MLTYTYRIHVNHDTYCDYIQFSNPYQYLGRTFFTDDKGKGQTLYLIYDLERNGKSIRFSTDREGSIIWREEE